MKGSKINKGKHYILKVEEIAGEWFRIFTVKHGGKSYSMLVQISVNEPDEFLDISVMVGDTLLHSEFRMQNQEDWGDRALTLIIIQEMTQRMAQRIFTSIITQYEKELAEDSMEPFEEGRSEHE